MKYKTNSITWKDIILVNGNYHYILTSIEFLNPEWDYVAFPRDKKGTIEEAKKLSPDLNVFNIEGFYDYIERTFLCKRNEIKTFVLDNIDVPEIYKNKINLEDLGGHINGIKI